MLPPIIRIVRPSSREASDLLGPRLEELEKAGFIMRYEDIPQDPAWSYSAGAADVRAAALQAALLERDTVCVWAARGGYGASDLLPLLDWTALSRAAEKVVVGFSDVSALHGALYAKLGWRGWHAPMPATALWRAQTHADADQLLTLVRAWNQGQDLVGDMPLSAVSSRPADEVRGKLFGGCFSVLTGLIGTPYVPALQGHIVFIEDVDESPARLMRYLNQWIQAGVFKGAQGLIIGSLKDLGENIPDSAPYVLREIARRVAPLPVFHTNLFGHVSPNHPLPIGADARISQGHLTWRLSAKERIRSV